MPLTLLMVLALPLVQQEKEARDLPAFLGPLRPPAEPADNPSTPEKVELGRMLYWDPRLSGNGALSCATCHNPALGWGDGLPKSIGFGHKVLGRGAPTVLNAAYYNMQFWDGRAATLEDQAKGPIEAAGEMNAKAADVVQRLNAIAGYRERFQKVFGGPATFDTIAKAIAAFERQVVDLDSPFDRWARGDDKAMTEPQKRGFDLFVGKARCATCHSGPALTDNRFHNIGLTDGDVGRMAVTKDEKDFGAFKTPTIRNAAITGPYMHDGSLKTLREVVDHYEKVVNLPEKPKGLSIFMLPFKLTEEEKADVVEFMKALTADKRPPGIDVVPQLPQ
ncbi:MAG TPA: cytochrome c peroxidase [Planctomycetota bacterium]|nr:cytochrome c peroxidase [Planctomycetota bacterium]